MHVQLVCAHLHVFLLRIGRVRPPHAKVLVVEKVFDSAAIGNHQQDFFVSQIKHFLN